MACSRWESALLMYSLRSAPARCSVPAVCRLPCVAAKPMTDLSVLGGVRLAPTLSLCLLVPLQFDATGIAQCAWSCRAYCT